MRSGLAKKTLHVSDSPGFVVNRLLAPYLNQALLMLEHGVDASRLAAAALRFGMPMSPLHLIDTIGIRTAFDSGRVFWQAFPTRLDPAPTLPGMIKAKRLGTAMGGGFYDRSVSLVAIKNRDERPLSEAALNVIAKYQREHHQWSIESITELIAIPMWIEAAEVLATKVVKELDQIELAMQGGLGNVYPGGFFAYFDSLGSNALIKQIESGGKLFSALRAPADLVSALKDVANPRAAIQRYAEIPRGECS